jgi:8-oxo-dGTP diphosphatase
LVRNDAGVASSVNTAELNRLYPTVPRLGVGVVVVRNRQFILVKRGQEPAKGSWSLPGGLVELGERIEDAARREVLEECGIRIVSPTLLDLFEYIEKKDDGIRYHYVVVDFKAGFLGGELTAADDVEDSRWFAVDDLDALECSEKIKSVVKKVFGC